MMRANALPGGGTDTMTETLFHADVDGLMAAVPDGAKLAIAKPDCGAAMAATRALIRRGARNLHLVTVPVSGLQADLLIGAGCVAVLETSGVSLGEFGPAPCFTRAVTGGRIVLRDATCPAIYAGIKAGEKGIPFMPLRGLIGSDLARHRAEFKLIDNPFAAGDPIMAIAAINPDIALIHAPFADRQGNVWIGRDRALMAMAHAARRTLVTVEAIRDGDLTADETLAPATLSSLYVTAIARAEKGAWPLGLPGHYADDEAHLSDYVRLAKTEDGFQDYLRRFVLTPERAAAE